MKNILYLLFFISTSCTAQKVFQLGDGTSSADLSAYAKQTALEDSIERVKLLITSGVAGVASFNGRSNVVVPQLSDYSAYFSQLSHTHSVASLIRASTDYSAYYAAISHTHVATDITTDATHRFVTDTQITLWNSGGGGGGGTNTLDQVITAGNSTSLSATFGNVTGSTRVYAGGTTTYIQNGLLRVGTSGISNDISVGIANNGLKFGNSIYGDVMGYYNDGSFWVDNLKGSTGDTYIGVDNAGKLKRMATPTGGGGSGTATTDASLLTSGTLPDARLSSNVVFMSALNTLLSTKADLSAGVIPDDQLPVRNITDAIMQFFQSIPGWTTTGTISIKAVNGVLQWQ